MVADRDVEVALAGSFLGRLPPEVVMRLRSEGERADYPAGTTIYRLVRASGRCWLCVV
jgi:CRP/FNR family transcriptional regulator, cyclic AMP receptor protein